MAQTSDIVTVAISTAGKNPTQGNFGTPLIAAYHTKYVDRVRSYGQLSDAVTDGFGPTDSVYKELSIGFAQSPRPPRIKVGRCSLPSTQVTTLTLTSAVQGDVYRLTVAGQSVVRTVPASSTTTLEATAVLTLINALSGTGLATVTSSGAVLTCPAATAGALVEFSAWTQNVQVRITNTDPGIATDLDAIKAFDADWFGLTLASASKAEITAAAAWAEANSRMFVQGTPDWDVVDISNTTTDLGSVLKAASYRNTVLSWGGKTSLSHMGIGLMCNRFVDDPGSDTWAFKTIAGVVADDGVSLTGTQQQGLLAKNVNSFSTVAGLNLTFNGKTSVGEWADVVRGVFWLASLQQAAWIALVANAKKIPFTDEGIDKVRGMLTSTLDRAVRVGLLAASPPYAISLPKAADLTSTDRSSRNIPLVSWSGQLAGAIHTTAITGTVTS